MTIYWRFSSDVSPFPVNLPIWKGWWWKQPQIHVKSTHFHPIFHQVMMVFAYHVIESFSIHSPLVLHFSWKYGTFHKWWYSFIAGWFHGKSHLYMGLGGTPFGNKILDSPNALKRSIEAATLCNTWSHGSIQASHKNLPISHSARICNCCFETLIVFGISSS